MLNSTFSNPCVSGRCNQTSTRLRNSSYRPAFNPWNRCRQRHTTSGVTRAVYDRTQKDPALRNLPVAPPPKAPPPPPPPVPPPAPPTGGESFRSVALATVLGLGIAIVWSTNIGRQVPTVMVANGVDIQGRPAQALVVKTKGGNILQVSQDEQGRLFFVDMKGNLYYDSGIKEVGFYFVGVDNEVFNVAVDKSGKTVSEYVGNMNDLVTARITDLGGIPVSQLNQIFPGQENSPNSKELTVFYDPSIDVELPLDTPLLKDKDGNFRGPPQLDEGIMTFERIKSSLPFSKNDSDDNFGPFERGSP